MPSLDQSIYLILCALVIYVELNTKINTTNVIRKIGLGIITVGCLVSLKQHNILIPVGLIVVLVPNICKAFIRHHQRRATDV
jgi:hypothetical protein